MYQHLVKNNKKSHKNNKSIKSNKNASNVVKDHYKYYN